MIFANPWCGFADPLGAVTAGEHLYCLLSTMSHDKFLDKRTKRSIFWGCEPILRDVNHFPNFGGMSRGTALMHIVIDLIGVEERHLAGTNHYRPLRYDYRKDAPGWRV